MRNLFFTGFIFLNSLIFSACGDPYSFLLKGHNFVFPIDPQIILGGSGLEGQSFDNTSQIPIDAAINIKPDQLKQISVLYLKTIALRSLINADFEKDNNPIEERLQDPSLFSQCDPKQEPLNFIDEIEIFIQKNTPPSDSPKNPQQSEPVKNSIQNDKVRIAHLSNIKPDTCSIIAEIDNDPNTKTVINLKPFFPDYTVTLRAKGTLPNTIIKVGGYISADFVSPNQQIF